MPDDCARCRHTWHGVSVYTVPPQTGLGVYPKPPVVEDAMQRGEFTGQRVETVTYICEQPGTYTLPALTIPALLRWLDRLHNGNDAVTVEQFVHRTADDELRDQVARLEWFAFGPASIQHDAWSGLPLYTSLVRARKRAIQDNGRSSPNKHGALPPLNPFGLQPIS